MTKIPEITFDEFKKADIRIGTILSAEKVPDADKLIKLMIDIGLKPSAQSADGSPNHSSETNGLGLKPTSQVRPTAEGGLGEVPDIRQILSGIAQYYPDPAVLIGKQVPVLTNLPVRTIRGLESQGMVLYAVGEHLGEGFLATVGPDREIPNGTPIQ